LFPKSSVFVGGSGSGVTISGIDTNAGLLAGSYTSLSTVMIWFVSLVLYW
jgi:hypothetical protein